MYNDLEIYFLFVILHNSIERNVQLFIVLLSNKIEPCFTKEGKLQTQFVIYFKPFPFIRKK